jgi:hypothetical protein
MECVGCGEAMHPTGGVLQYASTKDPRDGLKVTLKGDTVLINISRRADTGRNWLLTVSGYPGPAPTIPIYRGRYGGPNAGLGVQYPVDLKTTFLKRYRKTAYDLIDWDYEGAIPVCIVVRLYESEGKHLTEKSRVMTLVSEVAVDLVGMMYDPTKPRGDPFTKPKANKKPGTETPSSERGPENE